MTLVEKIEKLQYDFEKDDNFNDLKNALESYHEMVKNGELVPRENCLLNNYTIFFDETDLKFSNI